MTPAASSGVAVAGATFAHRGDGERLEELVFRVASGALAQAGLSREQIDSVTLAASDERDGRSISSMLTAAPAGGLYKEVTKVTDGSMHALALATMKVLAGLSDAHLVVSWDVASEADVPTVAMTALEPFADRPVGLADPAATAALASAYLARHGLGVQALDRRARRKRAAAGESTALHEAWVAHPLRASHLAPEADGAACALLVSDSLAAEDGCEVLGRLAGLGWRTDTFAPSERAWPPWTPLRGATDDALRRAGVALGQIGSFELDDATVFGECIACERIGLAADGGGPGLLDAEHDPLGRRADDGFVGLPSLCSGLWRVAQLCGVGGGARGGASEGGSRGASGREDWSLVHQAIGRAGQGHAVAIVRREGAPA